MTLKRAEVKESTWHAVAFYRLLRMVDAYYFKQLDALPVGSSITDKHLALEYEWAHKGIKICFKSLRKYPAIHECAWCALNQYRHNLIEVFGDDAVNHQVF